MSTDMERLVETDPSDFQVRVQPAHPLRANGYHPTATQTADLGAAGAALGMERGEVTSLVVELQQMGAATGLGAASMVLEKAGKVIRRRMERLAIAVRSLPEAPIPQPTGWRAVLNAPPPAGYVQPSYVSREAVLQLILALTAEDPKAS